MANSAALSIHATCVQPTKMSKLSHQLRVLFNRREYLPQVIQAAGWLLLAWLALDVLPGKTYLRMMRPPAKSALLPEEAAQAYAKRVRLSVRAASRRVPWRTVCFHEGLAAHQMLWRAGVPSQLHYGVNKNQTKDLEAHVWVTAAGWMVVGGETQERFTEIAVFQERGNSIS